MSQCVALPAFQLTLFREEAAFGVITVSFSGHLEVEQTFTHLSFPGWAREDVCDTVFYPRVTDWRCRIIWSWIQNLQGSRYKGQSSEQVKRQLLGWVTKFCVSHLLITTPANVTPASITPVHPDRDRKERSAWANTQLSLVIPVWSTYLWLFPFQPAAFSSLFGIHVLLQQPPPFWSPGPLMQGDKDHSLWSSNSCFLSLFPPISRFVFSLLVHNVLHLPFSILKKTQKEEFHFPLNRTEPLRGGCRTESSPVPWGQHVLPALAKFCKQWAWR